MKQFIPGDILKNNKIGPRSPFYCGLIVAEQDGKYVLVDMTGNLWLESTSNPDLEFVRHVDIALNRKVR